MYSCHRLNFLYYNKFICYNTRKLCVYELLLFQESSAQLKVDDNDENESFRGASDCEIELEEVVTTTPSTSTTVEIDNSSTSMKVKKKSVSK